MIHKLMDIFGKKDVNKSNSAQYTNSDQKAEKAPLVTENSVQDNSNTMSVNKNLNSSDNSNDEPSNSENLLMYLKSTAKSADDRKDCFGCKVTATVLVASSVLFAIGCIQIKRDQIVFEQHSKRRQRQASRNLSLIQLSLVGVCLAFTYGEWFRGNSSKTESEDTKA